MVETHPSAADRLYDTIGAILDVDPSDLSEDASPETIGNWDSVNHLNLVMALESEFEVQLSIEDALHMRSVRDVRDLLRSKGARV